MTGEMWYFRIYWPKKASKNRLWSCDRFYTVDHFIRYRIFPEAADGNVAAVSDDGKVGHLAGRAAAHWKKERVHRVSFKDTSSKLSFNQVYLRSMRLSQYQEKSGCFYMSSQLVTVADIKCPNCSKLALLEGQQMATIATSDFLLLT